MSSGGDTTTVEKADPWIGQQPYLTDLFSRAQQRMRSEMPQYFPGSTVAGFDPLQLEGQEGALAYARGEGTQSAGAAQKALQFNLGDVLYPESNPALRAAVSGAVRPVTENLTENLLPAIRSGASGAGQYGSTRQAIAEALALDRTSKTIGDISSRMYSDAYGQGLAAQSRALSLTPEVIKAGAMPSAMISGVGGERQSMAQALIDAELARWNFDQNKEANKLKEYGDIIRGQTGGGERTITGPRPQPNPWTSTLGGAATGYASTGSWIGALVGALAGFLGSR